MKYQLNNFNVKTQKCEVFDGNFTIGFCIYNKIKDKTVYENTYQTTSCICCANRMNIIKNICGSDGPIYNFTTDNWEILNSKVYEHKSPPFKIMINKSNYLEKNNIYEEVENKLKHHYCELYYDTDKRVDAKNTQKIVNKYLQLYWNLILSLYDKQDVICKIKNIFIKYSLNYSKKILEAIDWYEKNIKQELINMPIIDFYEYLGKLILSENIINIGIDCFEPYIKNFFVLNTYIKKLSKYDNDDELFENIVETDFSGNFRLKNANNQKYLKLAIDKLKNFKVTVHTEKELERLGAVAIENKSIDLILNELLNENKTHRKMQIYTMNDLITNIKAKKIYRLKFRAHKHNLMYTAKYNNAQNLFNVPHLWSVLEEKVNNKVYEISHIYHFKNETYNYYMFKTKDNIIKNFGQCLHSEFLNIKWESKFTNIFRKLNTNSTVNLPDVENISSGISVSVDCLDNTKLENMIEIQINDSKKWININS